jgi:hypothetical protein
MKLLSVSWVSWVTPAIKHDLRGSIRDVVVIAIGDEQEIRRRADPDAAEADFQSADEVQIFGKYFLGLKDAVAVAVLENQDAILALTFGLAVRITHRLRDPDAAARVEGEGNRLVQVGFRGEQLGLEAGHEFHAGDQLLRRGVRHWGRPRGIIAELPRRGAFAQAGQVVDVGVAAQRGGSHVAAGDADVGRSGNRVGREWTQRRPERRGCGRRT